MKICPYCAGKLVEEAIICKHCHAHLIIGHDDQVFRNPNILFERFVPIFFLVLLSIIGSFKLFTIFESKLTIASRQKELDEISRNLKDVEQLSEKPHQNFIQEVKGFRENSYEDYLSFFREKTLAHARWGGVEHGWETRPFPPYESRTGFKLTG